MRLALHTLIVLGAGLLAFDLARNVRNIDPPPKPDPTQAVKLPRKTPQKPLVRDIHAELTLLNKEIAAHPKNATLYVRRANIFVRLSQTLGKSLEDISQAVSLSPENTDLLMQRASIHLALRQTPGAIADYSRVLELSPGHIQALTFLATIHCQRESYAEALQGFLTLLETAPSHVDNIHFLIARCYKAIGNLPKAIEHLKIHIASSPDAAAKKSSIQLLNAWIAPHSQSPSP